MLFPVPPLLRRPRPAPRSLAATRQRPSSASSPPRLPSIRSDLQARARRDATTWSASLKPEVLLRFGSRVERTARCPCRFTLSACPAGLLVHRPSSPCRVRERHRRRLPAVPERHPTRRPGGRQRRLWRHRTAAQPSTAGRPRHATGPTKCLAGCGFHPLSRLRFRAATAPRHYRIPAITTPVRSCVS